MEDKEIKNEKWHLELKRNWTTIITIVLNPLVIIFILISFLLILYSTKLTDPRLSIILSIILSVITGLLGGVVSKKWDDLLQERIISTRAKSSVRNLQLLLDNSISLEKRVISFIKRITEPSNQNNITSEVIKTYFEEIITQCLTIENFIINSIQDWTDILPQANIESVITNIREMKNNIVELQSRLDFVNHELELSKEKTLEEIQEKEILIKEKEDLEAKLLGLYQESFSSANRAGYPTISGSLVTGGTIDSQAYLHSGNDLSIKWINPFSKNDPPEVGQSK